MVADGGLLVEVEAVAAAPLVPLVDVVGAVLVVPVDAAAELVDEVLAVPPVEGVELVVGEPVVPLVVEVELVDELVVVGFVVVVGEFVVAVGVVASGGSIFFIWPVGVGEVAEETRIASQSVVSDHVRLSWAC